MDDPFERSNVSFLLKLWLEDEDEGSIAGLPMWRGQITHALSGKRVYFQDLATLNVFLRVYIEQMSIKL